MKLPSVQYQDNLGGKAKRDISAPLRVAGAQAQAAGRQAGAAGAMAGAAGQEAQAARAMGSLYENTAAGIVKVEDYFLEQEATRQVQEAQSKQKIALKELTEAQDRIDPETGEPAWKSLENYRDQQKQINENITESMNPRARARYDPWAQQTNTANYVSHMGQADAWRREENKLQTVKTMSTQEKTNQFVEASATNDLALQQQTISPTEHWKNKQRIDTSSTMYTHNNTAETYVDTGNMKALSEQKEMVAQDTTLSPAQRKSTIAKIEDYQMNDSLEKYHAGIQKIEQEKNLDVAVAKGQELLDEVIRTSPASLGGDEAYRSALHSKMRTELNRYQQQLARRDATGKSASLLNAPLGRSTGFSTANGKVGDAKNTAYMTDPSNGQRMSDDDFLANKPTPYDGETPIQHITGYIASELGHLPKATSETFNAAISSGNAQVQAQAVKALRDTLSYAGTQGTRILKNSKISQAMHDRLDIGTLVGDQKAIEMMMQFEANPDSLTKQFSSGEAKAAFTKTWQDDSDKLISDIIEDKGTFNDTEYNISTVDQGRIKEIAKRLYPMVQNPELAIKAATEQVLAAGEYLKDNTTGTPTFSRKANSITNIEGFDSLSETDQAVAGQQAYDAVIIDNGGVEPDRTKIIYTTDPASSPNKPIFRATYINRFGMYTQSGQMSVDKKSLPDTAAEMEDVRIRNAQVKRAQTQKNLVDGALEKEKAGQQLNAQERSALAEEEGKGKMSNTAYWGIKANEAGEYASDRLSIGLDFFGDLINLPAKAKNDYYEMRREQERNNAAK